MAHAGTQADLSDEDDGEISSTFDSLSYIGGESRMKPKFEAMLKEIEQKLPSLDDDSDFEDDSADEIEIFQRPASYGQLIVEDEDKDLDESLTSSELSEAWCWKPSHSHNLEDLSTNNCNNQFAGDNQSHTSYEDEEINSSTRSNLISNEFQSWFNDSNRNTDLQETGPDILLSSYPDLNERESRDDDANNRSISPASTPSPISHLHSHRDRQSRVSRRDTTRARVSSSVTLSLGTLENVDLDMALQNVVEGEYRRRQRSRSSSLDLFDLRPGDNVTSRDKDYISDPNKCTELMHSLVNLSIKESGKKLDIDPMSGADRSKKRVDKSRHFKPIDKHQADMVGEKMNQGVAGTDTADETACRGDEGVYASSAGAVSSGTSTVTGTTPNYKVLAPRPRSQRLGDMPVSSSPNEPINDVVSSNEPTRGTVFLDLRKSEEAIAEERNRLAVVQRVLKLNNRGEKSSSESSSSSSDEEEDRDSWFEQRRKIRQAIERGHSAPPPEHKVKMKSAQRKTTPPRRLMKVPTTPVAQSTVSASPATSIPSSEGGEPSPPGVVTADPEPQSAESSKEKDRMHAAESMRKAKLEAENVLKTKQAFQGHLNATRPTSSVDQKRKVAPTTPTIYHMVSSHEAALGSLPNNACERSNLALLTVNLSSNGEIVGHRSQSSSNTLDRADRWSFSYIALVTWLCSCIPYNIEDMDPPLVHEFPFNVIGLQQMVIDGQLVLAFIIEPSNSMSHKLLSSIVLTTSSKPKPTNFYRVLNKFLLTTTLDDVNPYLPSFKSQRVKSLIHEAQYAYTPNEIKVSSKPLSTFIQIHVNKESIDNYFVQDVGYHWQTMNNDEQSHYTDEEIPNIDKAGEIQNTLVLLCRDIYTKPLQLFSVLTRMLSNGLDISGLRLGTPRFRPDSGVEIAAVLAIGVRGPLAIHVLVEELGPMDPILARQVAPNSLIALLGGDDKNKVRIYTPRNPSLVSEELARWFGGRVSNSHLREAGLITDSKPAEAKSAAAGKCAKTGGNDDGFEDMTKTSPVYFLSATTSADIFLVISPLLSIKCLGTILSLVQKRGFALRGVRRRRLNQKQISALGIGSDVGSYYMADYSSTPTSPRTNHSSLLSRPTLSYAHLTVPRPATILQLNKENALHNSAALLEDLMVQLTIMGLLGDCYNAIGDELTIPYIFHIAPYTDVLLSQLGREFTRVPELDSPASTGYIAPQLHTNQELEQISVLALVGNHMINGGYSIILARLLRVMPLNALRNVRFSVDPVGLELLGIKWVPALSGAQARELTPYEVGQPQWRSSIKRLCSEPALVVVFRGLKCAERIRTIIHCKTTAPHEMMPLDRLVSPTAESAYRLISLFFFDRELFADNESRPLMIFLPPLRSEIKAPTDSWDDDSAVTTRPRRPRSGKGAKTPPQTPPQSTKYTEESIYGTMQMGPRPIITVLIMKPSALAKRNLAKLLRGILLERFQIVGMRLVRFSEIEAACIQMPRIREDETLHREDIAHMVSDSSLVLALFRENAVKRLLELLGPQDPKEAKQLDPFLWRGMYGSSLVANAFYASTCYASAVADLKQFFLDGLSCKSTIDLTADEISAPGVDCRLSSQDRIAKELVSVDPGPYNLARLNEVNCIVMLGPLVRLEADSRNAKFTDIIHCLQTMELTIHGARMIWMTEAQAQSYLHVINAGNYAQVPLLCIAPIIVLAVQTSHAIISFDHIMTSGMLKINKNKDDYMKYMQTAKDVSMANRMLAFFFDELLGDDCKMRICEKQPVEK